MSTVYALPGSLKTETDFNFAFQIMFLFNLFYQVISFRLCCLVKRFPRMMMMKMYEIIGYNEYFNND